MANTPRIPLRDKIDKCYNGYQKDILYLSALLENAHPSLFENYSKEGFEKDKNNLLLKFEKKGDKLTYILELQKFLAKIKDAHTYIETDELFRSKKKFPVYLKWFGNELYVVTVGKNISAALIGAKVISICDKPVNKVRALLLSFHSHENEFYAAHEMEHWYLTSPEYLYFNSVSRSIDSLKLAVFSEKLGQQTVTIAAAEKVEWIPLNIHSPVTDYTGKTFFYRLFPDSNLCYFQFNDFFDKTTAIEGIKESFGPMMQFPARVFFHFYAKKHRTGVFRDFLKEMFRNIENNGIDNLVIDLRHNAGGNSVLTKQFLYYIEHTRQPEDFTELNKISTAYKKQYPKLYGKYNRLYRQMYGKPLQDTLINLEELEPPVTFFKEVIDKNSPYYIEKPSTKFKGKIFVLINPHTFSAASDFAVLLKDNKLCATLGTPSGNKPTKPTGSIFFKLPNTNVYGSVSHAYSIRPDTTLKDQCCLLPDVKVEPTIQQYLKGIDPVFEYAVKEISAQKRKVLNEKK